MVAQRASLTRLAGGIVLAGLALSACTSVPATTAGTPSAPSSARPRGSAEARGRPGAEASTALLEQARSERAAGSLAQASASIERALQIEPSNPFLWIELGEIKLAAGDREQAEMMGRKALALAGNDPSVLERAGRLLTP